MNPDRAQTHIALSTALLLAIGVAGHAGSAVAQTPVKLPSGDPCTVVPLADIQKAFPGAKPGVRDKGKEKYGITECTWKDSGGSMVFGVQEFYGDSSAMEEAKGLGPSLTGGGSGKVRYETVAGVGLGNEAVAIVEPQDAKRGIVTEAAMLSMHRGQRTLWLTSPALPARDRTAALKTLEALGRIAAKRLD